MSCVNGMSSHQLSMGTQEEYINEQINVNAENNDNTNLTNEKKIRKKLKINLNYNMNLNDDDRNLNFLILRTELIYGTVMN